MLLFMVLLMVSAVAPEEDAVYWRNASIRHLKERVHFLGSDPGGRARNVILFLGDGMGLASVTAAGIFHQGEGAFLSWERFPVVGLAKTYAIDKQVADSAATATAFLSGVKTRNKMLGLDVRALKGACSDANNISSVSTLAHWALQSGLHAGVVTTARITHATPGALYARINHRDWECDSKMTPEQRECVADIARQLVEEMPGKELRVILGGGWRQMGAADDNTTDDSCRREDGKNLSSVWEQLPGGKRRYVTSTEQLMDVDVANTDYLMGLFAPGHMAYNSERDTSPKGEPSLTNMTTKAIRMLQKNKRGYFLLVEGARIDMAHHKNYARLALEEAVEMHHAVAEALRLTRGTDTLVVVTADHSHAMTINGYPDRGSDILGLSKFDDEVNTTVYETISYANGPGAIYHTVNGSGWRLPKSINASERLQGRYQHFAPIYTKDDTHAGEDVPVYAMGPGAELLGGVYEQNYIAAALAHAVGIGNYTSSAHAPPSGRWWGMVVVAGVVLATR